MMMTLVLEPQNEHDYQLFVDLAKRLNVSYRVDNPNADSSSAETQFLSLAGSWQGDITTDELIQQIEAARTTKDLDLRL